MAVNTRARPSSVIEPVAKVILGGKHGRYAVCYSRQLGEGEKEETITFSLKPRVWKEDSFPTHGDMVVLEDIRERPCGLRAYKVCFKKRTGGEKIFRT
jgi:hypothetical protein